MHPFLSHHGVAGDGSEGQNGTPSSALIMSEALRGGAGGGGLCVERAGGGVDSLLPIVSSQRERFKQRNTELEVVSVW